MKVTYNGMEFDGTPAEIQAVVEKINGGKVNIAAGVYNSSRGPLFISEMETQHLINAVLKRYRDWISGINGREQTPASVLTLLMNGPTDDELNNLVTELRRRMVADSRKGR